MDTLVIQESIIFDKLVEFDRLVKIAKSEYGLRELVWYNDINSNQGGGCNCVLGRISLNSAVINSFNRKVKILFHELGHLYCYRNGIWKNYHSCIMADGKAIKDKNIRRIIILTGLKAERWIERWAEREIKKYIPNFIYKNSYNDSGVVKIYREFFLNKFK